MKKFKEKKDTYKIDWFRVLVVFTLGAHYYTILYVMQLSHYSVVYFIKCHIRFLYVAIGLVETGIHLIKEWL